VQQPRQGEVAHPRNREGARNDCESDQERTGGENLLHEGGAKEDPRGIRHHPSERDAAVSRGDSGPVSAKASRGESGEARGGGGDAEEATQAGGREGKRDEAPRRHEDKGDSDGRDAGKEGATLSESSTERGARDSENRNEQTDRAKRGREKKGGATEGIESASGKLEDGFIRFKLKAKIPVKEETTVKIQGKTAEEVKAKLVRTLDIERIGGPLSQMIPTKRGEVVLVSRSEEQRKMLETVLITTEGIEIGSRRKLNPVVTLTGLETGWKEEEIVEEVFQKNDWIRNTGTMEEFKRAFKFLARKRCQKSPKENLTFAVESRLHKALIERQKIGVRLTIVFVEEMVQVPRCYNCNGLGHISKSCRQKPKCHKCGKEGHKIKECRAEKSECGNCKQTGHRAYYRKCPTMKRALEWKIARTARC
jgi:transposase-like protein